MKLTEDTRQKVDASGAVKAQICAKLERGYGTIQKWVNENNIMLTTADALKIIEEELDIPYKEALEE